MNETDLVLRLRSKDEVALARLYEWLGPNVFALALRMLRNREDAEEVLQDTFVKLYQTAERFDPELGSARAYVYTIARNEARMRLRARRSRPDKADGLDVHGGDGLFSVSPESDHDARIAVGKAFKQLHHEDVELLQASFFQGYSHAELSERSGLPLGTVKSRLRRALAKLRDLLVDA